MNKPFEYWSDIELQYMLSQIEFQSELILQKSTYFKFYMHEKRKIIQPIVNKIYDDVFNRVGKKVTVKIDRDEYDYIKNWAEHSYLPFKKKTDYGYKKGDVGKAAERIITGTCGNLAVIKFFGGSIKDIDFSIGHSSKYATPDLKQFLDGLDVGVKTARTGEAANLPLMLNYTTMSKEYLLKNKQREVESQFVVGQNESNNLKYYIIGLVSPTVVLSGVHRAFTLDPKAMAEKKAGGAKGGFFAMHEVEFFDSKKDLCTAMMSDKYNTIKYGDITPV